MVVDGFAVATGNNGASAAAAADAATVDTPVVLYGVLGAEGRCV